MIISPEIGHTSANVAEVVCYSEHSAVKHITMTFQTEGNLIIAWGFIFGKCYLMDVSAFTFVFRVQTEATQ